MLKPAFIVGFTRICCVGDNNVKTNEDTLSNTNVRQRL